MARLLFLVLVAVMVGASGPVSLLQHPAAEDPGFDSEASGTFVVGEGGEGLSYTSHLATATDALALVDACGVYDPSVDYNLIIDGLGTGLAPPTYEEYADLVGSVNIVTDVAIAPGGELPAVVDHSKDPRFPIVDSQGSQGSCAAWACSYYANGYLQAVDNGWDAAYNGTNKSQLMSPAWVYNKINYGVDSGSNWYRNQALMASVGNADWATMPYKASDLIGWGNEDAWRIAPRYRIRSDYDLVSTSNTMVIKAWLAEGYVLPIALDAYMYSYLSDDDILTAVEYNSNTINHANTIVGYNDSISADGEAGAFLIVNSWGKTWSGNGYYWMTYDCLKELSWPAMRMYDMVDYEPELIGVIEQSTVGSKDCRITFGTESDIYADRQPTWWAGTNPYPAFMCLDITELAEDVSLSEYFLYFGSGSLTATVSAFEVEWYPDGYDEGNPFLTATSGDTPRKAPATMRASFSGVHVDQTLPARGTWQRANVTINGTATEAVSREVLREDFEGRWVYEWEAEDNEPSGGEDTWYVSLLRQVSGDKSAYVAGSDMGMALYEGFDASSAPAGWSTESLGPDKQPFKFVNSGYQGCGGSDYLAVATSGAAGTNVTERLYTGTPVNATNWANLTLRFYMSYDHYDGDEHVRVLMANGTTYPNFTALVTYDADTLGYQSIDLSSQDGEPSIYLAFEYHATGDRYVTIDDVLVAGEKSTYDPDMVADLYIATGDLSAYDSVDLAYGYWLDAEMGVDYLHAMYRNSTSSPWVLLSNHTGHQLAWSKTSVSVPTNASHVGFRFVSDGVNCFEGAYLDDVVLTGYHAISAVEVSVDGGPWEPGIPGPEWSFVWDSANCSDGLHHLAARVDYSGAYDTVLFDLRSDNTPPDVSAVWNDDVTTGEGTALFVNATDENGVDMVSVVYAFDSVPGAEVNVTDSDNGTWHFPLDVPSNATSLWYRFVLVDTIGNRAETQLTWVRVVDNDDPEMGPDLTPVAATTGDALAFAISATDNVEVSLISLEYWYEGGSVERVEGNETDFNHVITVVDAITTIHYRFTVTDTSANSLEGETRDVPVSDDDPPAFDGDSTPSEATTGENVTFRVRIADNIELNGTWVEYWFGGGEHENASLETEDGLNWSLTVDVPWDSVESLHYLFHAVDTSGNTNSTARATVTVLDNDLPWIDADNTYSIATTGDEHLFEATLKDNIQVAHARVEYWYDDGSHMTVQMQDVGAGWIAKVTAANTVEPMYYVIHVEDSSGNAINSTPREVTIVDNDGPVLVDDNSPSTTTTGVDYGFSVKFSDNLGVGGVEITYWYDGGQSTSEALELRSGEGPGTARYGLVIPIPGDSTASLHYTLRAWDSAGNENVSAERTVAVLDVTPPVASAGADVTIDQHQEVSFDPVGSSDNVGLVTFTWVIERGGVKTVLEGSAPSHVFHDAGVYTVTLTVEDPSGNTGTDTLEVVVNDITLPVPDAGVDRTVDQNTTVIFDGTRSRDNVAIVSYTWTFEYGGVPKEFKGSDILFIFSIPGVYPVKLTVVDRAGNTNSTTVVVTVKDTIYPEPHHKGNLEGKVGEPVTFDASASWDNVGIVNWTWTIRVDGSGKTVEVYGREVEYTFDEPGDHRVMLTVRDADGNTASAEEFTVHVPNVTLWIILLVLVVAGVSATAGIAAYTRWKTRKLDEQRARRR